MTKTKIDTLLNLFRRFSDNGSLKPVRHINNIVKNFLEKNIAIHPLTEVRGFLAGGL